VHIPDLPPPNSMYHHDNLTHSNNSFEQNILTDPLVRHDAGNQYQEGKQKKKSLHPSSHGYTQNVNKVSVDLPLVLQTSSKSSIPQLKLLENSRISMFSMVPPSTPTGRFSVTAGGNCRIHQAIGSSQGSIGCTCKVTPSLQLVGGLELTSAANTRPLSLKVGGIFKESNQSSVQITARQLGHNSWGLYLATKDVLDPWILSSNFSWHPVRHHWNSLLSVTSMTTHIVRLSFGWKSVTEEDFLSAIPSVLPSWISPYRFQLIVDPKLSPVRRLPLFFEYQPHRGTWSANASLQTTQPAEKYKKTKTITARSSWRIGIQRGSRWSVVFSWQQGDITFRVPIVMGAIAGTTVTSSQSSLLDHGWIATATPFVICAIVGLASEMISQLLWAGRSGDIQPEKTPGASGSAEPLGPNKAVTKAKQDAAAQQRLMKRQAESRRAFEEEKNGLVITSALYKLGTTTWDVTIPMQFWVSNDTSTLSLAATSKDHLLGFYPLSNPGSTNRYASTVQVDNSRKQSSIPWWQEFYTPTAKRQKSSQAPKNIQGNPVPTLEVTYKYQGQARSVNIKDSEALHLPGP